MAVFLALVGRSQGVATTTYPSKKRQTRPAELVQMMPHEPFAALEVFQRFPENRSALLCRSRRGFLGPLRFFENWSELGVGLVEDVSYPKIHWNHSWRAGWRNLIRRAGLKNS